MAIGRSEIAEGSSPRSRDLLDGGAAFGARRRDLRGRRVGLLRDRQLSVIRPSALWLPSDTLRTMLVVAGIEVTADGERDLLAADFLRRDVEAVLEVVDQPLALDDLADHVDVVELFLSQVAGLEVGSWNHEREIDADLVRAHLRKPHELRHAERHGTGRELGRHRQDLVDPLVLDDRRLEELARAGQRRRSRPEAPRSVGLPDGACGSPCSGRCRRAGPRPSRRCTGSDAAAQLENPFTVERQPEFVFAGAVRFVEDEIDLALQGFQPVVVPDLDRNVDLRAVDRNDGVRRALDDEHLRPVAIQVVPELFLGLSTRRVYTDW